MAFNDEIESGLSKLRAGLEKTDVALLRLGSTIKDTASGFKSLTLGTRALFANETKAAELLGTKFKDLGTDKLKQQFINSSTAGNQLAKSLTAVSVAGGGLVKIGLNAADVSFKFGLLFKTASDAKEVFKDFAGVNRTLSFSEAITGSADLARNFEVLSQTSNKLVSTIKQTGTVLFNNNAYQEWSSKAVSSFAPVEEAAFRLSTILVSGSERSIDKLSGLIEKTRELQKETNFAVDSVSLLNTSYNIASGGFTEQSDFGQVAKASVNLAQVGFGDQDASTEVLVKTLRALGDTADDANKRAAQIFETTKIGITTVNELSAYLAPLASQANALGIDFGEVTAALAQLTTQGLSTAEATTALSRFLEEVAANSSQAKEALAGFIDESGRTIQLGAGALQDKGIAGILEQLESATNGQLPALQKIFGSVESQRAASLLINSGTATLRKNTTQIQGADESALAEEAVGRTQTLFGAFNKARNESTTAVEQLGQAISSSVLSRLQDTETVLGKLTTGSAAFAGSFAANLDALAQKTGAVVGFISKAFLAIGSLVIFDKIFAVLGVLALKGITSIRSLFAAFMAGKKEGESTLDFLKRKALETFETIKIKAIDAAKQLSEVFKRYIKEIVIDIRSIPKEIDRSTQKLLPAAKVIGQYPQKLLPGASSQKLLPGTSFEPLPQTSITSIVPTKTTTDLSKSFNTLKSVAGTTFNFIGGAIKSTIVSMGALAAASAVAVAGFKIISGWAGTLSQLLDEKTNPAIAKLTDSLESLRNIKGIDNLLNNIETGSGSIESYSVAGGMLKDQLNLISGLWNTITGQTKAYEQFIDRAAQAQEILKQEIKATAEAANQGKFIGTTVESKAAQRKINLGLSLNTEDINALENENQTARLAISKEIEIVEQKIADTQARGGRNKGQILEQLNAEKAQLKQQAEQLDVLLEKRLNLAKASSVSKQLQNIDTEVPINIQLNQQATRQVQAEIEILKESVNQVFNAENLDPERYARLLPELESALGAINVQLNVDPQAALDSLQQIQNIPNIDKLLFSDVNLRNSFNAAFSSVTDAALRNAATLDKVYTGTFERIKALARNSPEIVILANDTALASIDNQISIINKELNNSTTSYQRQVELLAELESLEGERVSLNAESQAVSELGIKKQMQTLAESTLQAEQARVNLLSQENNFATGIISAAQARLNAAQQELETRKEQLTITAREQEIEKSSVVDSLRNKLSRQTGITLNIPGNPGNPGSPGSPGSKSTSNSSTDIAASPELSQVQKIQDTYNEQTKQIQTTYDRQKQLIEETYKLQKEAINAEKQDVIKQASEDLGKFSPNQQATIVKAFKEIGFGGFAESGIAFNENREKIRKFFGGKEAANLIYGNLFTGTNIKQARAAIFDENGRLKDEEGFKRLLDELENTKITQQDNGSSREARDALLAIRNVFTDQKIQVLEEKQSKLKSLDQSEADLTMKAAADTKAAQQAAESRRAALNRQKQEAERTQKALEASEKELEITKALNEAKASLELFSSAVDVAKAKLDVEFASREKTIKQGELLAQSLSTLAQNPIFSNGSVGANLRNQATQLSNPVENINIESDKAVAQINTEIQALKTALNESESALAKAEKAGASDEQLALFRNKVKNDREQLNTRISEADADKAFILIKSAADRTAATLQLSQAALEAELTSREAVIERNVELGNAFSKLASTASSLFSSSALGASLNRVSVEVSDPTSQSLANTTRRFAEAKLQVQALQQLFDEASKALEDGIKAGLSESALQTLSQNKSTAADNLSRAQTELAFKQQNIANVGFLDALEGEFRKFGSVVEETMSLMKQEANVIQEGIKLRKEQLSQAKANNDSIANLESSMLSYFGNNPGVRAIAQRQQFNRLEEERKTQQADAVFEAQSQVIDLSVMEAQLALEQKGYANSLVQTQLLSGLLAAVLGDKAKAQELQDKSADVVAQVENNIKKSQEITAKQQEILNQRIDNVIKQLPNTLLNIDRNITAEQNNLVGQDLLNPDLIDRSLNRTRNLISQSERQQIEVPRFDDPEFINQINNLRQIPNQVLEDANQLQPRVGRNNDQAVSQNISAPITISLVAGDNNGTPTGELDANLRAYVNAAVSEGINRLSTELRAATI